MGLFAEHFCRSFGRKVSCAFERLFQLTQEQDRQLSLHLIEIHFPSLSSRRLSLSHSDFSDFTHFACESSARANRCVDSLEPSSTSSEALVHQTVPCSPSTSLLSFSLKKPIPQHSSRFPSSIWSHSL
jgi:hypothetical protein